MEKLVSNISINTAVPACYIERGESIKDLNKLVITRWLQVVNLTMPNAPRCYQEYIKWEIIGANYDHETWRIIQECDHIWLNSIFEMPLSAFLFVQYAKQALAEGIRNKIILNCAERRSALHYLAVFQPDARDLIQRLQRDNRIAFYFWEDIKHMLRQRIPDSG